jgi:hypothetical protein
MDLQKPGQRGDARLDGLLADAPLDEFLALHGPGFAKMWTGRRGPGLASWTSEKPRDERYCRL